MPQARATTPFNIRLWFAAGGLLVVLLLGSLQAFWISTYIQNSLLEREGQLSQQFLESIVRVEGETIFDRPVSGAPPNGPLAAFANHLDHLPGLMRANIYLRDHTVLWSSATDLTGKKFVDNEELDEAFEDERVTELGTISDHMKAEHVHLRGAEHFVESYLPIHSSAQPGRILGVVEFYRYTEPLETAIRRGQLIAWVGTLAGALVLFLALYGIVHRGAMIIERQQQSLLRMEAFAAIGQMASAIAHSLRNPMSSIRSTAELWASTRQPEQDDGAREVIAEVDRMDAYVRDLLAYSRTEASGLKSADILELIDAVIAKKRSALDRNGIAVSLSDKRAGTRKIAGDPSLLEQAVTSVFTNALEATPPNSGICITVEDMDDDDGVRLTISDSGSGLSPEVREHIGKDYFTTKPQGLGLGLVLTRAILERFGGAFELRNGAGGGAVATLRLKTA